MVDNVAAIESMETLIRLDHYNDFRLTKAWQKEEKGKEVKRKVAHLGRIAEIEERL